MHHCTSSWISTILSYFVSSCLFNSWRHLICSIWLCNIYQSIFNTPHSLHPYSPPLLLLLFPLYVFLQCENNDLTAPIFQYLKHSLDNGIFGPSLKWNFTKFLCDKNGVPQKRYCTCTVVQSQPVFHSAVCVVYAHYKYSTLLIPDLFVIYFVYFIHFIYSWMLLHKVRSLGQPAFFRGLDRGGAQQVKEFIIMLHFIMLHALGCAWS